MGDGAMGRVAAIYDIHGNLPALEAVLAEIEAAEVDGVVVGGDVLPGPMPGEVLNRLLALDRPVRYLRGNGDRDVLEVWAGRMPERVPTGVRPTLRWVAERLEATQADALERWPATLRMEIAGLGRVLFCHATPRDDAELFTERTPEAALRPILDLPEVELVVCGHTHIPFDRRVGSTRVVNAGSVGMPFGATGAWWALLGPGVERRRTEYSLDEAAARIVATGYPSAGMADPRTPPSAEAMLEAFERASLGGGEGPRGDGGEDVAGGERVP